MASRSSIRRELCIFLPLTLAAGVAWAQTPATQPAGPQPATPRAPEYAGTSHVPKRLLDEQVGQAVVMPSEPGEFGEDESTRSGTIVAKITTEPKPLPDGYTIGRRPGRVERKDGCYLLRLEHLARLPDAPPLQILPNTRLALLETALAEGNGDRRFLFTGRITEFQGANYILLDHVTELTASPDESSPPSGLRPPGTEDSGTPATKPAGEPETRPAGREPTAEDLIRQLMRDKPTRPLNFPEDRQPTTAPARDVEKRLPEAPDSDRAHWRDETLLSDRSARLVHGDCEGAWMLAFEDAGKNPTDRAVRILPGRLLEMALNLTAGGTKPVVLIVSGEVTAYRGTNSILLRKVLVRKDMGNLR